MAEEENQEEPKEEETNEATNEENNDDAEAPKEEEAAAEEKKADDGAKAKTFDPKTVVTRFSILDIEAQTPNLPGLPKYERVLAAFKGMLKGDGGTSKFFKLASYHGQPGPALCAHGTETFPGWHRIYLMEFEKELRQCDVDNGNDGNIGLPYWDWEATKHLKSGLPNIGNDLYKDNNGTWPENFFPKGFSTGGMGLVRPSNRYISQRLKSERYNSNVPAMIDYILTEPFHYSFACNADGDRESLEDEHGSMHMIVGARNGVMGSLALAAFDVMFWLHHCNVDRIYERYLDIDKDGKMTSQSHQEFQYAQNYLESRGYDNNYTEPFPAYENVVGFGKNGTIRARNWNKSFDDLLRNLPYWKKDPTKPPTPDNRYYPKETFDTTKLGFKYYDLPHPGPLVQTQLRTEPTFVIFPKVKESQLKSAEYTIIVFLVEKGKKDSFEAPKKIEEIYDDTISDDDEKEEDEIVNKNLGGCYFFFGRSDFDCENCAKKRARNVQIDVTKCLERLKLSRHNVDIIVRINDAAQPNSELLELKDTNLPEPIIAGPLFESNDETLDPDNKIGGANNENEVKSLQTYLKRYGYYDGKIDGKYGKKTTQSIKDYQASAGIKQTGIADPATKKSIVTEKRCENVDPFAENDVKDKDVKGSKKKDKIITYNVGPSPDLKKEDVAVCIKKAFDVWAKECGLEFKSVDDEDKCDIKIYWKRGGDMDDVLKFDGPGGVLGHGGDGFVMFDGREKWCIGISDEDKKSLSTIGDYSTYYKGRQPIISLYSVAVHEIGHALGVPHIKGKNNVMSPYYQPILKGLQKDDISYIKKLYGDDNAADTDTKEDDSKNKDESEKKEAPKKEDKKEEKKKPKKKTVKKASKKDTAESCWKEISKKKNAPINWYIAKPLKKSGGITIVSKGKGGLNELKDELKGKPKLIRFAILRVTSKDKHGSDRAKFIWFKYIGSKAGRMDRAQLVGKMGTISDSFPVKHLTIDCDEKCDSFNPKTLSREFLRVGGAHKPDEYDYGGGVVHKN